MAASNLITAPAVAEGNIIMRFLSFVFVVAAFGVLIRLAHVFLKKGCKGAATICAVFAGLCVLGSLGWVQGFFKTGVIGHLISYGDSLQACQETIGKQGEQINLQHKALAGQQSAISKQQSTISNQQESIFLAQADIIAQQRRLDTQQVALASGLRTLSMQEFTVRHVQDMLLASQERLEAQQKKLSDVQTLVENMFSRVRDQTFRLSDTNDVCVIKISDSCCTVAFRLKEYPVPRSVSGYYGVDGDLLPLRRPIIDQKRNVYLTEFKATPERLSMFQFMVSYVADPTQTNVVRKIRAKGNVVVCDDGESFIMCNSRNSP